jgi:hypothetical protein
MTPQLFYGECDDCRSFNYLHEVVTIYRDIRHVCTGCYEEYKYRPRGPKHVEVILTDKTGKVGV